MQFEKQLKFLSKMIAFSRRIDEEIETIVLDEIPISEQFCLQLDEYYLANVRFVDGDAISCRFLLLYKSGVP